MQNLSSLGDLLGDLIKKKAANILKINILTAKIVHPWGVEPQSMEPESIILSIELWVQTCLKNRNKNTTILYFVLIIEEKK